MTALRLGAVSYLNTKPLVYGLRAYKHEFDLRFDVPSKCASLLHEGRIDLGLVPAIEYLRGDYSIVPDVAIGSRGEIASVAVFSKVPIDRIKILALDISSRTSVALTRILCGKRWGIAPTFTPADPELKRMLERADAALVIGDPALEIDAAKLGVVKTDLGSEWHALTGLPFVYAMWTGRPGVVSAERCRMLQASREQGVANVARIAREAGQGNAAREARALHYLRDNLKYRLGEEETAGLRRFHELAAEIKLVSGLKPIRFYDDGPVSLRATN